MRSVAELSCQLSAVSRRLTFRFSLFASRYSPGSSDFSSAHIISCDDSNRRRAREIPNRDVGWCGIHRCRLLGSLSIRNSLNLCSAEPLDSCPFNSTHRPSSSSSSFLLGGSCECRNVCVARVVHGRIAADCLLEASTPRMSESNVYALVNLSRPNCPKLEKADVPTGLGWFLVAYPGLTPGANTNVALRATFDAKQRGNPLSAITRRQQRDSEE